MGRRAIWKYYLAVLMLICSWATRAQGSFTFVPSDTVRINLTDTAYLSSGTMTQTFNGIAKITSNEPFVYWGSFTTSGANGHILLKTRNRYILSSFYSTTLPRQRFTDTCLIVNFWSRYGLTENLSLTFVTLSSLCPSWINSISANDIDTTSATICWLPETEGGKYVVISNDGIHQDTSYSDTTFFRLTGLNPSTTYTVSVADSASMGCADCYSQLSFKTLCTAEEYSRLVFDDLTACPVTCTYGTYQNPYADTGIVDNSNEMLARHRVITDTSAYDPRTNNLLKMVPPGDSTSIRLGNWNNNYEAEAVCYKMRVDTTIGDLLILRYAAVLQDPTHLPNAQPKFMFKISDSTGTPFGSCYTATFVSGNNLGWQTVQSVSPVVLYKDWTTVGLDLAPLHGSMINIELTTFDCNLGEHYGYAYYTLKLGSKHITSFQCGETESSTFVVPDGFVYRWYAADTPDSTLGTSREITLTQQGEYCCDLSFVGSPNCKFTMKALAGTRYPKAQFNPEIDSLGCRYKIRFRNTSVVATDSLRTQLSQVPCESYQWVFDDTILTHLPSPYLTFPPGHHTAMLIAYIAGGGCTDTCRWDFDAAHTHHEHEYDTACYRQTVSFRGTDYDTAGDYAVHSLSAEGCDSTFHLHLRQWTKWDIVEHDTLCYGDTTFWWQDGNNYTQSTSQPFLTFTDEHGCDSTRRLGLIVLPFNEVFDTVRVCDNAFPISWEDTTFYPGSISSDALRMLTSARGCDSLRHLHLKVSPTCHQYVFDTICSNQAATFEGSLYDSAGTYDVLLATAEGCDSLRTMELAIHPVYEMTDTVVKCNGVPFTWMDGNSYLYSTTSPTAAYMSSQGCDSIWHLSLTNDSSFKAAIWAFPEMAWEESPMVELRDISEGSTGRVWEFADQTSTEKNLTFDYYELSKEDSMLVVLASVGSNGCIDTASRYIYADKTRLWVPNVFTPREATNNRWFVSCVNIHQLTVYIYDRNGHMVHSYQGINGYWDGTSHGQYCKEAAYVYRIRYTTKQAPAEVKELTGTVLLLY